MRELGPTSEELHREIGDYARAAGIERLWGVGPELSGAVAAFGPGGRHFSDRGALLDALTGGLGGDLDAADTLLVKGSRGAAMEHLVPALLGGTDEGED